jgi:DNA-binding NarL/FixJ family response regulator
MESDAPLSEVKNMPLAARTRAADDAGTAIERQLNGPLTALLLYMGEIKQYSDQLSLSASNRIYLQQVVDNALKQTERVCALIKQLEAARGEIQAAPDHAVGWQSSAGGKGEIDAPQINFLSAPGQKPLTKREREVLNLISEGYSNKQGALQMQISPRTFESHRAVAMRKLGARNTADLVRTALGHPGAI